MKAASLLAQHLANKRPMPRRIPWLWPYGCLVFVLGLIMWPAWFSPGRLISSGDMLLNFYPAQFLFRQALAEGELPFWNRYTFSGVPAFANMQLGYSYLPHWVFLWMPTTSGMNWIIGLHVVLAGVGAAWCASRLGASREGQFVAGVSYAFGSAMISRLWAGHLALIETNAWLPVATGLAIQVRRRLAVVYLTLVLALIILAGQPEIYLFSIWWLPLFAGLVAVNYGWRQVVLAVARVGLALALALGLAAVNVLPFLALISVSFRQAGVSWDFATSSSLPPWHLLEVLAPTVFGNPQGNYWPDDGHNWHERLLYVGLVPLLASGLAAGRRRWLCWGAAAVAIALSFGSYAPWYAWAVAALPGYGSFRVPPKHLTLAALALALAAGLGIGRLRGPWVALAASVGAVLLHVGGLTFDHWFPPLASVLGGSNKLALPAVRGLISAVAQPALQTASLILALAALACLLPRPWALRSQLALATLELAIVLGPYRINPTDPNGLLAQAEPLRGFDRAAWTGGGGALLANFGPMLGVTQPDGYSPLFNNAYGNLVTGGDQPVIVEATSPDNPALDVLGYATIYDSKRREIITFQPPPPRAWVAHCVWPGGAREVRRPEFPRRSCITRANATEREPPLPPSDASLLAEGTDWVQIEAAGPGWLVTTVPWYPGWSATLDGAPTAVEAVDGALIGLRLPAGEHRISLSYRPAWLEVGLLLSLAAALLLAGLAWLEASGRLGYLGEEAARRRGPVQTPDGGATRGPESAANPEVGAPASGPRR